MPAYAAALYSRCIARKAVLLGMASGFIVSLIWMIFFFDKTAAVIGLCQLLAAKPSLVADTVCAKLMFVDPIVIALSVSALVTLAGRYSCPRDIDQTHIDYCFNGITKS